jgi:hypothetical protein
MQRRFRHRCVIAPGAGLKSQWFCRINAFARDKPSDAIVSGRPPTST